MTGPRRAAVLGSPIAHSLSPVLHRAAYEVLGLDLRYDAYDVNAQGIGTFLDACGPDWVGVSLTMPLKEAVLPLLDERSGTVELARAANTVILVDGRRIGHNTDVPGLTLALQHGAPHLGVPAGATVLGAGATARSAVVALGRLGVRTIEVVARRVEVVADLAEVGTRVGAAVVAVPWSASAPALSADLVVSTVPGDSAAELTGEVPWHPGVLLDVVYDPWPTSLATGWSVAGGTVVPGLELLVQQAALQVELMTGCSAPVEVMRTAGERALDARGGGAPSA